MDETAAITLCLKHRDPAGFDFLVRRYRREAFYHAAALVGSEEEAADACQECFRKAFVAMPRLPALDAFYPWFYRILRNHCLNVLARQKTARDYAAKQSELDAPAAAPSPAELTERSDERARVWEVLRTLAPVHREILVLKYIHGLRYDGIAEVLAIPRGTVMSRLHAARQAFRSAYPTHEL